MHPQVKFLATPLVARTVPACWRSGRVPADWRDGIIVTLYKPEGPKTERANFRPITLHVSRKVFARLGLIQPLLDKIRRSQQSWFSSGRSTIDAILALRLLPD